MSPVQAYDDAVARFDRATPLATAAERAEFLRLLAKALGA